MRCSLRYRCFKGNRFKHQCVNKFIVSATLDITVCNMERLSSHIKKEIKSRYGKRESEARNVAHLATLEGNCAAC